MYDIIVYRVIPSEPKWAAEPFFPGLIGEGKLQYKLKDIENNAIVDLNNTILVTRLKLKAGMLSSKGCYFVNVMLPDSSMKVFVSEECLQEILSTGRPVRELEPHEIDKWKQEWDQLSKRGKKGIIKAVNGEFS